MSDFDLNLRGAEEQLDEADIEGDIVLGILDGSTDPTHWTTLVANENVLILAIEGDLNELAAEFARDVRDAGGELMHFRKFLIVTPKGVSIDTTRL